MLYRFVYACAWLVSRLPYRVLYGLSDGLYLVLYYVVRYRRGIVRKNLTSSFPEKSRHEILGIERKFYRWLCDYGVETVKLLTVSDEELLKHIEFRGTEAIERCFDEGQPCAGMLGHYCNWEYLSTTALGMKRWGGGRAVSGERRAERSDCSSGSEDGRHAPAVMGLIYKPLRSDVMDRLFLTIRGQKGGTCVSRKDILRKLVELKRDDRMSLFGYIADQGPRWENIHLWLPFMNHDTPVFTGSERIIRKMGHAVFYIDMDRPYRGKYICTMRPITRHPEQMAEYELTRTYFQMLEKTIRRAPQYYLWSHNRWKRTRQT